MPFEVVLAVVAFVAGAIASIAGFGIGSVLTPFLIPRLGAKLAVAAVSIPHVIATAIRFWMLRRQLDRRVLLTFGVSSAIGGLAGALLQTIVRSHVLTVVLAILLVFAGVIAAAGITLRFGPRSAWIAGAMSGLLGGLVGNQGGIRAGGMMGFDVPKESFVATATAVALIVDAVRMPVYAMTEGRALVSLWPLIAIATFGAVAGTLLGRSILGRIPDAVFRRVVGVLLIALGIALVVLPHS
jgi:uncharacterized membrane protein YfcA